MTSDHDTAQAATAYDCRQLLRECRADLRDPARPAPPFGVEHEAATICDHRRRGAGLDIAYGFHECRFGDCLLMTMDRAIAGLAFVDEDKGQSRAGALADMTRRWPLARYNEAFEETARHIGPVFDPRQRRTNRPLRLLLIGTPFDVAIWQLLLRIPAARFATYADLAKTAGRPSAARAVGSAVGRNPISFIVPCHRVLRGDGGLGGYYWGLARKQAMIAWEIGWASLDKDSPAPRLG